MRTSNVDAIQTVSFIGAGNLATQLALTLFEKQNEIQQIYSRTLDSASLLASQVGAEATDNLEDISAKVDLLVISISDKAMPEVVSRLQGLNTLVVHTAGSVPMDILSSCSPRIGVFYPTQTFTKAVRVSFDNIPLCIEANRDIDYIRLKQLAQLISTHVTEVSSAQRKSIHLAAVFACNFSNHMLAIADDLLQKEDLPLDILKPLVVETIEKAFRISPKKGQSGPAIRHDQNVIAEHMVRLSDKPLFAEIYEKVTKSIQEI
ncbi:DUF2520 domain-containing protein [Halosquirtibacter laminarini]|uniref:DUF2520 domain-containing protein n=1 Tax=Halosquirtibacter laminarini TaxID=3374600 RepID=A0AC61NBT2_9BACT|nr:DUF2520 domain-containing protein [Prolixibacteraceae bacterium]